MVKLKIYRYSEGSMDEKYGELVFITAASSKKEAIRRIQQSKMSRSTTNWISQRMSILDELPSSYDGISKFNPFSEPYKLFIFETHKRVNNIISWRKNPKLIKTFTVGTL